MEFSLNFLLVIDFKKSRLHTYCFSSQQICIFSVNNPKGFLTLITFVIANRDTHPRLDFTTFELCNNRLIFFGIFELLILYALKPIRISKFYSWKSNSNTCMKFSSHNECWALQKRWEIPTPKSREWNAIFPQKQPSWLSTRNTDAWWSLF